MEVFHQLSEFVAPSGMTSIAIGNFDGCHMGHLALLDSMLATSKKLGTCATVLTFFPHPVEVLKPHQPLQRLMTTSEKLAVFEKKGIEKVLVAPFNKALAEMSAEDFYEKYLRTGMKAKSLHVGDDFNFGHLKKGNTTILSNWCQRDQIELSLLPKVEKLGERVSSSRIRTLIREGEMEKANQFLTRPYSLSGEVVHGFGRGNGLGVPTANLRYPADKLLPQYGVYVTESIWQKQSFPSVCNVGIRPTFEDQNPVAPTVEVHFLKMNASLYSEFVQLNFISRLREEKKFASIEELKSQIQLDIQNAEKIYHKYAGEK
jgi:riboflavin kinase/FMN adenylyltransferase